MFKLRKALSVILIITILAGYFILPAGAEEISADQLSVPSQHVIQIVLDGLDNALYNRIKAAGAKMPNLDKLISEGTKLNGIKTVIPAFGGSQAAALTGAGPTANGYTYKHYDRDRNKVVQNNFSMKCETIFEALKRQEDYSALATGWSVGNASIDGRGVAVADTTSGSATTGSAFLLKEYNVGKQNNVVPFETVADDIIDAIEGENVPSLLSGYCSDIRMVGWEKPTVKDNPAPYIEVFQQIDNKLGEILEAVEKAGIKDTTTIIVHSLSDSSIVAKKYTTKSMAEDITNSTGVKTVEIGDANFAPNEFDVPQDAKAVIVKQYVMHNTQLYFTSNATEDDKTAVIKHLNDKSDTSAAAAGSKIAYIYTPEEIGLDKSYCDLFLVPVEGVSFASTSTSNYKTGRLENNEMFFAAAGANILPGGQIRGGATVKSLAATICNLLGAEPPKDVEEMPWYLEDLEPVPVITVTSPKDNSTVYENTVKVSGYLNLPCKLTINGHDVPIDENNNFSVDVTLVEGENEITVVAVNSDLIESTKVFKVKYLIRPDIPDGNIGVYINWDAFADYYLNLANAQGKIPNLIKLIDEDGVYLKNNYVITPSITNPSQAALAAGAAPRYTGNHYRYFNKELNKAIQETPARLQKAETLAEAAVRQYLDVISINQFAFEDMGTVSGSKHNNYVVGGSNGIQRFDELIKLIRENKTSDGMEYDEIPRFIALYCDDLDAIGHNEVAYDGVPLAETEAERIQNIIDRMALFDQKLGELIQACEEVGIYDNMSFLITGDHGMSNFGIQESPDEDNATTKLPDLIKTIENLGDGFKVEFLQPSVNPVPSTDTDIALITAGLQVQLSYINEFDKNVIEEKNAKILEAVKNKKYVGETMTPEGIKAKGNKEGFADLIISPKTPYFFHNPSMTKTTARGQHDSLEPESQKTAAILWGKDIKKGLTYEERTNSVDLIPTLAHLIGINIPMDSNGRILYDILIDKSPEEEYPNKFEAESGLMGGPANKFIEKSLSGELGVSLPDSKSYIEFAGIPSSVKLNISYACLDDIELKFYVNDKQVRNIFFPETNGEDIYDIKALNYTFKKGDNIRFAYENTSGSGKINFDTFTFISNKKDEEKPVTGSPFGVAMTPDEDSKTSVRFNWLTYEGVSGTVVEVVENSNGQPDFSKAEIFNGISVKNSVNENGVRKVYVSHKAVAEGLTPGTKYSFRVGDGTTFSDYGTFTTSADNGEFTFLYLTDSQGKVEGDYDVWKDTYEQAFLRFPDAAFAVMNGDLIDTGLNVPNNEAEWLYFLEKPKNVFMNVPMAPVVGNHEGKNNNGYEMHFNTPNNGKDTYSIPESGVYSFDYGDAHIAVLNTEMLNSAEEFKPQVEWLRHDMIKTDKKWKIVAQHKALYSVGPHTKDDEINNVLIPSLLPVVDELGIDLIVQGHDHVFARSGQLKYGERTGDVITGGIASNPGGTMYLINNSAGVKFYEPVESGVDFSLFDKHGQPNKQAYTGINVSDNRLKMTTYLVGEDTPYDEYTIERTDKKPEKVSDFKIEKTEGGVKLYFKGVEGAKGYYVYEKNGGYLPNWVKFIPQKGSSDLYEIPLDLKDGQSSQFEVKTMSERAMSLPASLENEYVYVVSVEKLDDITVKYGTSLEEVLEKLPKAVKITDSNGAEHESGVNWTVKDYDENNPGDYNAIGTLLLPEGIIQNEGDPVQALLKVTLNRKSSSGGNGGGGRKDSGKTPTQKEPDKPSVPENPIQDDLEEKVFKDLDGYLWAETAIEKLASLGIIKGTSETTFEPGRNITRADFITLLVRAFNLQADFESNFADVSPGDYYYQALGIAKKLGIAEGTGGNRFNPKQEISRQDMMVLTKRALEIAGRGTYTGTTPDLNEFSDVSQVSGYAIESVAGLVKSGIIEGKGSIIDPKGMSTRAEIAVLIYRILNIGE